MASVAYNSKPAVGKWTALVLGRRSGVYDAQGSEEAVADKRFRHTEELAEQEKSATILIGFEDSLSLEKNPVKRAAIVKSNAKIAEDIDNRQKVTDAREAAKLAEKSDLEVIVNKIEERRRSQDEAIRLNKTEQNTLLSAAKDRGGWVGRWAAEKTISTLGMNPLVSRSFAAPAA